MEPALLVFKDLSRQIDEDGRRIVASGQSLVRLCLLKVLPDQENQLC